MDKANRKEQILELLNSVKDGQISPDDALLRLQISPFKDLGYANIDYHRGLRQGVEEIIYGQNKTPEQIKDIILNMRTKGLNNILITRASQNKLSIF